MRQSDSFPATGEGGSIWKTDGMLSFSAKHKLHLTICQNGKFASIVCAFPPERIKLFVSELKLQDGILLNVVILTPHFLIKHANCELPHLIAKHRWIIMS